MKESKFFYKLCKCIYKPLLKFLYRPKVYGVNNIPENGALIFAGNHKHAFDPVVVMSNTKRMVHFIAKEEVSKGISGLVFTKLGAIIIHKEKSQNLTPMKQANGVLKQGGVLGIFPEGTRNRTEKELLDFKYGTVTLAKKQNAQIIPFAIRGNYKIFKKGLEIEFGKAFDVNNMEAQEANDYLKNEVLELLRR